MRWPLARQILLPMLGILLLTAVGGSMLSAWLAGLQVQRQLERQLVDVAQTLSASNFPLETNVLRQTRGLTGAEYVLSDGAGQVVAATEDALQSAASDAPPTAAGFDLSRVVNAQNRKYFQAVVLVDRRRVGGAAYALHVFYPQRAWQLARWQATWPPLAIGGAACLLVGLAAYVIGARVAQPISQLRGQVERIALGDFTAVAMPTRNDEVRDLAAAVNQMTVQLTRYEEQTRRSERLQTLGTLGAGIAHQIRNAATGCRIAVDLHQRDCPAAAANGAGETPLTVAVRQLELIEAHIQRFLTLGRTAPAVRSPVAIEQVVAEAVALVQPMARHVGAGIETIPHARHFVVAADRESLVQLLVNLLVNAVQAAAQAVATPGDIAADTRVMVQIVPAPPGRVKLEVGDPGPGPAAAIRQRLFEPFATDKPGGTGLGLVVARQIAADHGGSVDWLRRGEWTWFVVELPVEVRAEDRAGAGG